MDDTRDLDIVVYGATGFTGRLVAEYLARRADELEGTALRWALAGRSMDRLRAVRGDLAHRNPALAELPLIEANSREPSSLRGMVARTQVVLTTVGPYLRYGEPLVAACAEAGTHYCDLTGEVPFMRRMIDRYHAAAEKSGARIVHTCGFDSIPSDLGVWMMHRAFADAGAQLDRVAYYLGESRGGFSGGTTASALEIFSQMERDPSTRRLLMDPYALDPFPGQHGPDARDEVGVRFDDELGMWVGPFVMSVVNTRVVRRTNALLGHPYGRGFQYSEQASFGAKKRGRLAAYAVAGLFGGFYLLGRRAVTRRLLERVLPGSGDGPSESTRQNGYFRIRLLAEGRSSEGRPLKAEGVVAGTQDPGYGETSKMIAESALCLAGDGDALTSAGGILTPVSAMGDALLERLRGAGMVFDVTSPPT